MEFEHLPPINAETIFYERFKKVSFLEKTSQWAKRICYGFILLSAISIVLNLVYPFANNAPDLFIQLLFLLIFWGTIELLTIPLEYIQDHCIVDFEKNWVALSQQRFFYRKITVIATFNEIKAIGVSARPPGLGNAVFSNPRNSYAIFMLNLNNQLFQISDYNLDLDEANAFCHRLYSSHFSGAAYIGGAPGMEIFVDKNSGEVSTRPAARSANSFIDALALPLFQITLAFILTISILSLALSVIERVSKEVFSTDLRIRHQPVFQLLIGVSPEEKSSQETDESVNENIRIASGTVKTIPLPFPTDKLASQPVEINIAGKQIIKTQAASHSTKLATLPDLEKKNAELQIPASATPVQLAAITENKEPEKEKSPDSALKADITTNAEKVTQTKTSAEALSVSADNDSCLQQQAAEVSTNAESGNLKSIQQHIMPQVADTAIPGRTPEVDLAESELSPVSNPKIESPDMDLINAVREIKPKTTHKSQIPDYSRKTPQMKIGEAKAAENLQNKVGKVNSILPGIGIHKLVSIGQNLDKTSLTLGKPITRFRSIRGIQIVYANMTILADDQHKNKIDKILITKSDDKILGTFITPQGIKVGSKIAEIEKKYGPPTIYPDKPGMHYEKLGISFIPSALDPDRIGIIEIYDPVGHR
ncbi:MAG: hypothetical protein Kow0029_15300 [Candidatus Rifleibacteriota bacterium]